MPNRLISFVPVLYFPIASAAAAPPADWSQIRESLRATCYDCHNAKKTKGGVDLETLKEDPALESNFALWDKVKEVVEHGDMPPEDADQLMPVEKKALVIWLNRELEAVAQRNAGDPSPVTLRRLTNAEYDYTVRDLTGHDYGIAKEFQPDGGGGEGFSNIGDVLFTSPQQLDKYLAAARKLADHATVMPGTGIVFHAQRVGLRGPDQLKGQAEQGLYVFLQKMALPHLPKDGEDFREADYMLACWKWKHREQTGASSLEALARESGLRLPFLENWWRLLERDDGKSRYLSLTTLPWRALPGPDPTRPKEVPAAVLEGVKAIQVQRRSWDNGKKAGEGVQRRQQDSDGLHPYRIERRVEGASEVHLVFGDLGDGNAGDHVIVGEPNLRIAGKNYPMTEAIKRQIDRDRKQLAAAGADAAETERLTKRIQRMESALGKFSKDKDGPMIIGQAPLIVTMPLPEGATDIVATGRLDMQKPDVDAATVQWTFATGNPPDPKQIIPGVLTVWKRGTEAHRRTMREFDIMKEAFPDVLERRLENVADNMYRSEPGRGVYYLSNDQLRTVLSSDEARRLEDMRTDYDYVTRRNIDQKTRDDWDRLLLEKLHHFADQAWRRPTTQAEREDLSKLYHEGVTKGLDRETAAREVITRVLVSPHFLFKMESTLPEPPPGTKDHPVNPWELASRLSYFLWSSQPDSELRKTAADGSLLKPEVRDAQVRRMLKSPRAVALAREFAGQWLEFDGFQKHSAVDGTKFPSFNNQLRDDMYAETVAFLAYLIREDRPVMEILTADYTFLNERLAAHYGVPGIEGDQLRKVNASPHQRGGLLGMGSILTKTSRSHRTSPVLRGNWLLTAVLGTPVPPPPPDVPELPEHAEKPATVREMLERHRDNKACSGCHDRIDPLGFALENFDAIGRFREKDDNGLPLDVSAQVKGSAIFSGVEGLRNYLKASEDTFLTQFSRKLLGFALGRQVLPSDKPLLTQMRGQLKANQGKPSSAVLEVINSRQFLHRRVE